MPRMPGTFVNGISLVGCAGIFAAYTEWDGERIARGMIKRASIVEAYCVVGKVCIHYDSSY